MIRATGRKAWKIIYRHHGRPRWLHLGDVRSIGLADARKHAARVALAVIEGRDPAAEKQADRTAGTFAELAAQYLELWAKKHNKSWRQGDALVKRLLLPQWGRLKANAIGRSDVRMLAARISSPTMANQTLAAASAIFSWAVKQELIAANPCKSVERNPTKARERVLSDSEVKQLWPGMSPQLRLILLTGQRPGEVYAMQRAHIVDGWWHLPGAPQGKWPGTKNGRDHRVWLSERAAALVGARRGPAPRVQMRELVAKMGIERATPHDLRRTALTTITRLGFGRDAMDRIANHKTSTVTDVYDRHGYDEEDRRIMEAVARHVLAIAEGTVEESNVVSLR
jgi:integrase